MSDHTRQTRKGAAPAAPPHKHAANGHRDLVLGIVILGVCALLYYETTNFDAVPRSLSQNVPAHFFPRLLIYVVVFLTILMMVQGWRKAPERRLSLPPVTLATILFVVVGIALIHWIGVLASVALLSVALPLLWGARNPGAIALYAVLLPASLYVLFTLVMQVRFPTGMLPF